ncbi:hypothetical protein [Actinoallomurus sp. NPDC050550]|uniref:hypothetical protein n=1 Tax=Actinoallomurus sp. NPDC050550 TaxID=3154937 RepID=UPI0033E6F46C
MSVWSTRCVRRPSAGAEGQLGAKGEQVRGQDATPETDLWSLGATLYAAVEGQVPFGGASAGGIFVAIATEDPHPFVHAGPLTDVLAGLLDKDPARRLNADDAHRLLTEQTSARREEAAAGLTRSTVVAASVVG